MIYHHTLFLLTAVEHISEQEMNRVKRGWGRVGRVVRRAARRIGGALRNVGKRVDCWLFGCRRPGPPLGEHIFNVL